MRAAVFVGLIAFAVYLASFRTIASVDASTNVLLGYTLVRDGDPFLDEFSPTYDRISYWSYRAGGHDAAIYPPGAAMLAAPVIALGLALRVEPPASASITLVGKTAAALAAAASVVFVHLAAARVAGAGIAMLVATLYAFGTVTWPISAGGLWQHGPAQLWIALGLWLLLSADRRMRLRSGMAFGLAALTRPTAALFGIGGVLHLARRDRPAALAAAVWTMPAAVLLVAYDLVAFGQPLSPYYEPRSTANVAVGLAGLLISPSRGLLVYSPFVAVGAYELVRRSLQRDDLGDLLRWQCLAAAAYFIVYASFVEWWGGTSYGPRYLAELLPLLSLGVALWLQRHARDRRAVVAIGVLGAVGMVVAAAGALFYDWTGWSWELLMPADRLVWRWDLAQPWYTLERGVTHSDPAAFIPLAFLGAGLVMLANVARRAMGTRGP